MEGRSDQRNKLATKILNKTIEKKRLKADIGEEFMAIGKRIQNVINEGQKHGLKYD
jgi:hypothetical protein